MRLILILCIVSASSLSAEVAKVVRGGLGPLTPDLDPFYKPPAGYESKAPGHILATRRIVGSLAGMPVPITYWQLLYRTTDALNRPLATVTTIAVPLMAQPNKLVSCKI